MDKKKCAKQIACDQCPSIYTHVPHRPTEEHRTRILIKFDKIMIDLSITSIRLKLFSFFSKFPIEIFLTAEWQYLSASTTTIKRVYTLFNKEQGNMIESVS